MWPPSHPHPPNPTHATHAPTPRTSRSAAPLDTSAVATSRSSMLKSSLAAAALEGMNRSLYVTRFFGDQNAGGLRASDPLGVGKDCRLASCSGEG